MGKTHKRDPNFRHKVLTAYGYKCAICGFDCRLGHTPIGLEAAHIKWHQSKGPSTVDNGIAMCALHHKAFDRGVFSIDDNYLLLVNKNAYGSKIFSILFKKNEGNKISLPPSKHENPNATFLKWHRSNIFSDSKIN